MNYKIYPLGESAITIEFGNEISVEKNNIVLSLANEIQENNFEGYIESVPAYSTLTVFYNVFSVRQKNNAKSAFDFVSKFAIESLENLPIENRLESRTIEVPVSFDKKFALDLEFVAATNNLKTSEVIEIFLSNTYRVFMIGFLPGFAYMGELDEEIATPRKQTPRNNVPQGSVGIAGKQTGIYPFESPGGWQIIGRTDLELFSPSNENPTLFQTGDLVNFVKT